MRGGLVGRVRARERCGRMGSEGGAMGWGMDRRGHSGSLRVSLRLMHIYIRVVGCLIAS